VFLCGPVHSQKESTRIEQMVRQVEGVIDVMNALHIHQELGS
jgi:osmotically-inducible protein OsmY